MAILSISTNTRLLGLAIITEQGLQDFSIRLYKAPWSPRKANLMITGLEPCVRQYCPKTVILSIPPLHYQTKEWQMFKNLLCNHFAARGIAVQLCEHTKLHALCTPDVRPTKDALMQSMALAYPQLRRLYKRELRNKHRYYIKLFEAVGAAHLAMHVHK